MPTRSTAPNSHAIFANPPMQPSGSQHSCCLTRGRRTGVANIRQGGVVRQERHRLVGEMQEAIRIGSFIVCDPYSLLGGRPAMNFTRYGFHTAA